MNKLFISLVIILTTSYIVLTLVNNGIIVVDTPTTSEVVEGEEPEVKKTYWDNGKLESETHYKNGKKEGLGTWWFESGEKKSETHWKNEKREGLETRWYESGKKWSETHYKNGGKEGLEKTWLESGKKAYDDIWKNGKQVGRETSKIIGGEEPEVKKDNKPTIHHLEEVRGNPNQSSFDGAKGYPDKNNSVNVKYKNSINGMKVDVIWEPFDSIGGYIVGEATIRFENIKTRTSFSIYHSNFGVDKDKAEVLNLEWDDGLARFKFEKKTIHIDNKVSDTNDWYKSDIFFYDLDFDGNKELITYLPGLANRGLGKFNVYEIKDGNPIYKEEEPYSGLSARSTIDRENKTISLYQSGGACNSTKKIYRFKPSHNIKKKGKYFLEKFYRYDVYMYECHLFLYDVDQDRNLTLVSKENLDIKTNSSAN